MRNKKLKKGSLLIFAGIILILIAFIFVGYNLWDGYRAGIEAGKIAEQIDEESAETAQSPDYILNPDMEMPVITIGGNDYIGTLSIPGLQLKLPVMSEWSYPNLKTAPCRYTGSVYKNDMVIAAHNYNTHFGHLKDLSVGDKVIFTDVSSNIFTYQVAELDDLNPADVEDMITGNWDLTLFTCTVGGQTRITIRCEKVM